MMYFDNAATTFPKPRETIEFSAAAQRMFLANPGRSGHKMAMKTLDMVVRCREEVAELFHFDQPDNVIFTKNATEALNIAIKGVLKPGYHVVISSFEHNAVYRPVVALHELGVSYSVAAVEPLDDGATLENFRAAIQENTALICCNHISNVFGNVLPIEQIAALAQEKGIPFLLDASQSAGTMEIDLSRIPITYLCAPGHKGLLGPTGTGILLVGGDESLIPLMEGGTGSLSISPKQPDFLPDRLESGTLNVAGIAGLLAGVRFVRRIGEKRIGAREERLVRRMEKGLSRIPNVTLYLPDLPDKHLFAFNIDGMDSEAVGAALAQQEIAVRCGIHCAPLAHESMGTEELGCVRVSPGYFNTEREADAFVRAVARIQKNRG